MSPRGGVIFTPATVISRSLRGTLTFNTPSFSLSSPFTPVSRSIVAVSSAFSPARDTTGFQRSVTTATASAVRVRARISCLFMVIPFSSPDLMRLGHEHALACSARFHGQVVEITHAVGFGPEPDLPCISEDAIVRLKEEGVVQVHPEVGALHLPCEGLPDVGWHLHVHAGKLRALAPFDLVELH